MVKAKDYFGLGIKFHGHKCPAMPLGLCRRRCFLISEGLSLMSFRARRGFLRPALAHNVAK